MAAATRTASGGLLFPAAGKVAKRAGRNRWFLHFLARYNVFRFVTMYHTFTQNFRCRIIVGSSVLLAPLPLILTSNNVLGSTVESASGSGAKRTDDASYTTKTAMSRERVVKGRKFVISTACRKSRNLGFWLSFWTLLGQWPKVSRARRHGISPVRGDVGIAPYGWR